MIRVGCSDQGKIILIRNGEENPAIGVLAEIGLRRIEHFAHNDVGAAHQPDGFSGVPLTTSGSRKQLKHGLWVAEVDLLAPDQPIAIPPDLQPYANALARLLAPAPDSPSPLELPPVEQPWRLDDCGWVANRWCDLLAMPSAQKQSLLQLDSPLLRLELVGDLLTQRSMP